MSQKTRGRERRSQAIVRREGVWVHFSERERVGVLEGERDGDGDGDGKVVGWERVETIVER